MNKKYQEILKKIKELRIRKYSLFEECDALTAEGYMEKDVLSVQWFLFQELMKSLNEKLKNAKDPKIIEKINNLNNETKKVKKALKKKALIRKRYLK